MACHHARFARSPLGQRDTARRRFELRIDTDADAFRKRLQLIE
jgi:hypothetical protein